MSKDYNTVNYWFIRYMNHPSINFDVEIVSLNGANATIDYRGGQMSQANETPASRLRRVPSVEVSNQRRASPGQGGCTLIAVCVHNNISIVTH